MKKFSVLWIDDEIDQLKSHILFLEGRNYKVTTCVSGRDALNLLTENHFDIVLLDENMPGLSGLETLMEISKKYSAIPVIMITRNEEESIMEEAIGSKIADYLIKPVNPNQILLSLKKNLDHSRIVSEKTTSSYQQEFRKIAMDLTQANSIESWISLYRNILYWELQLENLEDLSLMEVLEAQKAEANLLFSRYIEKNYAKWLSKSEAPILSHKVFKELIAPRIQEKKTLFLLIDNLRLDQWLTIEESITTHYRKTFETSFVSILPTTTQYARNAIFAGLTPLGIVNQHSEYWINDHEQTGKNLFEPELLALQLNRLNIITSHDYFKINTDKQAKQFIQNLKSGNCADFVAVVYNFVDQLSHARTDMEVIKALTTSDRAYRSLTLSWFNNSPLLEIIQEAKKHEFQLIITTDHGTINVNQAVKVIGDREISSNLRYKTGKSLTYSKKDVVVCDSPESWQLPAPYMSSAFIFAKTNQFFAYPNNFNHYVNFYRNTFQHGGISLEEMILPFTVLEPK
ncbi:MAG: hypothetical protein RLZZ241_1068 [Bacteroidota bacterium]|jgi:CheY-like chemotaxis protein